MATVLSMKSLEELCLTHVGITLEQYSTDSLSLLPKGFRVQLLHKIPIIDICRLEDTTFVTGIDMESIWKQIFVDFECVRRQRITSDDAINKVTVGDVIPSSIQSSWKHHFFSIFLDWIIHGKPYGHYKVPNSYDEDFKYLTPTEKLVTARAYHLLPISYGKKCKSWHYSKNAFQFYVARHCKPPRCIPGTDPLSCLPDPLPCLPPPGKAYHKACQAKQFVPPRYAKFFYEGSRYLSDSTALELIAEKCHFQPKKMSVVVSRLVLTFFLEEGNGIICLEKLMKNVESLRIITGGNCSDVCEAIPSKILRLIVQQEKPKLTSVTVNFSDSRSLKFEDLLNSLPLALTFSYNGLKELNINGESSQLPNLDSLVAITEHHCSLHTVSLGCCHSSRAVLIMSMLSTKPWLKVCFIKPSLRHFNLSLSPMPTNVMMDILAMFLFTPRSQEQTLTFSAMDIGISSARVTSLPDITLERQDFEDSILQLKSLEFCQCSFGPFFMNSLLNFPSFKVKQISTKEPGNKQNKLEALHLTGASTDKSEDCDTILSNDSLKTVQFVNCSGIDCTVLREAATQHRFKVEEIKESDEIRYTLTRM